MNYKEAMAVLRWEQKVLHIPGQMHQFVMENAKYTHAQRREAHDLAIAAMEMQISKQVIHFDKHYYKCVCGHELSVTDDDLYVYGCEPPKHCEACGRKLRWKKRKK